MLLRPFLARLLLALSLLAFQQGALAHALTHLSEYGGQDAATLHDCDLCHGYAAAGNAFAGAKTPFFPLFSAHALLIPEAALAAFGVPLAPSARGPPSLF